MVELFETAPPCCCITPPAATQTSLQRRCAAMTLSHSLARLLTLRPDALGSLTSLWYHVCPVETRSFSSRVLTIARYRLPCGPQCMTRRDLPLLIVAAYFLQASVLRSFGTSAGAVEGRPAAGPENGLFHQRQEEKRQKECHAKGTTLHAAPTARRHACPLPCTLSASQVHDKAALDAWSVVIVQCCCIDGIRCS